MLGKVVEITEMELLGLSTMNKDISDTLKAIRK